MNEKLLDIYNSAIKEQCEIFNERYREVIKDSNPQKRIRIIEKLVEKLESEFNATLHESEDQILWGLNLSLIEQLDNYPSRSFIDNLAKARDEYFNNRHFKIIDKLEGFDFVAKLGTYRAWHNAGIPMFIMGERPLFEMDDDNPYSEDQPSKSELFERLIKDVEQNTIDDYNNNSNKAFFKRLRIELINSGLIDSIDEKVFLNHFIDDLQLDYQVMTPQINWRSSLALLVCLFNNIEFKKKLPFSFFISKNKIKVQKVVSHFTIDGETINKASYVTTHTRNKFKDENDSSYKGSVQEKVDLIISRAL